MATKIGSATWLMDGKVSIPSFSCVGGKKEGEGPFGEMFDYLDEDDFFGQKSFEDAESAMQGMALQLSFEKLGATAKDIDLLFGGDLLNQCIGTSFGTMDFSIPFFGIYGACSTISEGLSLSALTVDSKISSRSAAITSSHFCTAERQYRFPLNYGGQRTPNSQWTATASGSLILERGETPPFVKAVTVGKISELGVTDSANMGAAMAPAAAGTVKAFFLDTGKKPEDFDFIITGDLGLVGSRLFCDLLLKDGIDLRNNHLDCGEMLYDRHAQDVHSGGSGCGCAAAMLCGHFLPKLREKSLANVLFAATGALLSPTSTQQGKPIPGISHLAWLSSVE